MTAVCHIRECCRGATISMIRAWCTVLGQHPSSPLAQSSKSVEEVRRLGPPCNSTAVLTEGLNSQRRLMHISPTVTNQIKLMNETMYGNLHWKHGMTLHHYSSIGANV